MRNGVIQQLDNPQTIYDKPSNLFVAGFIGSPTMNFLTGTLEHSGDNLVLRHGTQTLPLPGVSEGARAWVGRTVIAGIRPENLRAGEGGASLRGVVDVVEPTGPDTMVIVNVADQLITARLQARDRPKLGEPISLHVDTAAISLFDPQTESRI